MTLRHKLKWLLLFTTLLFTTLLFTACLACRNQHPSTGKDARPALAGEPETYSAIVVRLIEEANQREESATRIVCSGEMRREEWTEASAKRALIFRPDLGKSFLLDLDNRLYVESDLGPPPTATDSQKSSAKNSNNAPAAESDAPAAANLPAVNLPTVVDDVLVTRIEEEPVSVETRALPDENLEGRVCQVAEQKATFADGHVEITRTFCAASLNGLMVKSERETLASSQRIKITTERRDIKLEVSADEFAVPAGFKKVERLLYR